jgi:hypothetical protein
MLEAFDLTGSLRDAAELAGCSHHTVGRYGRPFGSGGDQPPERLVGGPLRGEIGLDLGWASGMGEARVPAAEAASQVVVEDGGTDLEEELSSGR